MKKYVTKEIAQLAKDKGYDESSEANWWILAKDREDKSKCFYTESEYEYDSYTYINDEQYWNAYRVLVVPTLCDLQTWLRNTKGVMIDMFYKDDMWSGRVFKLNDEAQRWQSCSTFTYEDTLEIMLKEGLEYL
jgi:hypothetical protein